MEESQEQYEEYEVQEEQQPQPSQPILGTIPYRTNNKQEGMLNQHLQVKETLQNLKMMLLSYEYNENKGTWEKSKIEVEIEGKRVTIEEPPLMDPREVKTTMSYLEMMLNSNTFLSVLEKERINTIMVEVNFKLMTIFYRLRRKMNAETRELVWGMLEYPILFGMSRAQNKITLDAISKSQHTIENIQLGQKQQQQEKKAGFNFLGFGGK